MKQVFIVQGKEVEVQNVENLEPICALHGLTPQEVVEDMALSMAGEKKSYRFNLESGKITLEDEPME